MDWQGNTPVVSIAYSPFGEAARTDDGSLDSSGTDKAQWAGMYNDPTSRLYYARNRYYDPEIARFISEDPMGLLAGPNVYAYCHNDPINFIDPLGLWETGSYWGDVGAFGKGELGAAANFVVNTGNFAINPIGALTNPPIHVYSPGCTEAERSGEWFGDQLYAVGAVVAGFAKSPSAFVPTKKYIVYVFKNEGKIVYVGKSSGYGTAEEVLKNRLRGGRHEHWFPKQGDTAMVWDEQKSKAANEGAEHVWWAFLKRNRILRNKQPPLSARSSRKVKNMAKIKAYMEEFFERK